MKYINRQEAIDLIESKLEAYRIISPDMPEEVIHEVKDIPYGWYFTIGLKNPACSNLYYGAYTDYIVDKEYQFMHVANSLDTEAEIEHYGKMRQKWSYRMWWRFMAMAQATIIKSQLLVASFKKASS